MNHAIEILKEKRDQLIEENKGMVEMLRRAEKAALSHQKSIDRTNEMIKDLEGTISRLEAN